ncbi:hypothetical protein sscle_03g027840 [Sclerotinia sclerotiorum 1980 UF-70]|uniref:Uncharacterized protein n=1 Tax=Sclerotinia sclerotiorum (strain ATCC 18683 / 1980 / Ss-1) TaxID=665079 RepID=A0A1D9PZ91_SCLS1|nr:hypothetical protein sscle_03g027840 [Sclerotinia sclerotiorum 1980 UF-70]
MNPHREHGIRRRMELNPITTSLHTASPHHQTPGYAISGNLSSSLGYNPSQYNTPLSSVRQYNPSQWTSSPNVSGGSDGSHFSARPSHDPDVVIPAPPPYSPPRSNRPTGGSDEPMSSASAPPQAYRSSPEAPHTPHTAAPSTPHPNYPPPPGGRSRAGSNDRPLGVLAFSRRSVNHPENPRMSPASNREPIPPVPPIPRRAVEQTRPETVDPVPVNILPPGSRRAASTGAISSASPAHSRDPSTTRWQPGMPLPPPPPGRPPPPRSQSMTRATDAITSPPTRRPLPASSLGPVPPTPLSPPVQASAAASNWPNETPAASPPRDRLKSPALHVDTASVTSSTATDSVSGSSSSSLTRSRAVRGEKTIRERRSESRNGRTAYPESAIEQSNNPWAEAITPSDINVPLARHKTMTRTTPRSGRSSNYSETPRSSQSTLHNLTTPDRVNGFLTGSRGSTPRPVAHTPPFSPESIKATTVIHSPSVPPKSSPTPPPQSIMVKKTPNSRPPSLIIPKNDFAFITASTPSRPATGKSISSQVSHMTPADDFARSAAERHEIFVQREASATNDTDRVRIFAEFIVNESRIRRDRYASAIDAMGSEILDLTRDLFRPNARRDSTMSYGSDFTPESSAAPRSHRSSLVGAMKENLRSQHSEPGSSSRQPTRPSSRSNSRPGSRANSAGPPSPEPAQQNPQWWSQPGYMPSLSPIPSMSVSEALDGASSRGRPSSRWWEVSQQGSDGVPSSRFERSKRESKYMGMPKELREALQFGEGDPPSGSPMENMFGGPSNPAHLGPNEYPREKTGFHEPNQVSPVFQPIIPPALVPRTPFTPNPDHLDISRLVTLPPPYPRHHPAVNNNHPDLTSIRTTVRMLSDIAEVTATKERFVRDSAQMQEDQKTAASKRRASLRLRIQRDIEVGTISYADAAAYEADAVTSECIKSKEAAKSIFELFQSQVVLPVNELLMTRIQSATDLFEQLRSKLFNDSQDHNPTSTQEEGDEQPELIEKLTLLKWIFEAREQLHREVYELLSDRNDRYKEMIITPYRLSNNVEKVRGAESFFAEDAQKRKQAFESEILKRTEEFMDIIEENVVRGVEVQLGAFWDIAPSLSRLIEQIPKDGDLKGFMIQIPKDEYEENPSYYDFPMQYLYTLIVHAGKSTYQFIESQTNLLCLLHEVKVGVTAANCRLMGTQRIAQGEAKEEVERELEAVKSEEEGRLTDDLKEKVKVVEELWRSGLGTELDGARGRILNWLKSVGGELPPDDEV